MNKKLIFPLVVAALAALFASQNPDGLDTVSGLLGFGGKGIERTSPMTGYTVPFLGGTKLSTVFAGIAGVLITYGVFAAGLYLLKKLKPRA